MAQHWKRERTKLRLEEIPGEEKEELNIVDIEEIKALHHDDLEQEIKAMQEGVSSKRPDLVKKIVL